MVSELGRLPNGFYSWDFPGEFRAITEQEFQQVKNIKGITRARVDTTKLYAYWKNYD
jgi:hypothetical protein